jgi:heme-dependent oxidative N-demethylase alpha subunit-like protein
MPHYTPYDGSATPFTIGLKPLPQANWLEPQPDLLPLLRERHSLLSNKRDAILRCQPEAKDATRELLELVLENLKTNHHNDYEISKKAITIKGWPAPIEIERDDPLAVLGRIIPEDFCLIRKTETGHQLIAAILCFPSSWALADKVGKTLERVHDPVPDYHGPMSDRINLLLDRLRSEQIVWRMNWSLDEGERLFRPSPHSHDHWLAQGGDPLDHVFIRVERQTLRRLPIAGDIIFTIRIHLSSLRALATKKNKDAIGGLHRQLSAMSDEQCAYKGLAKARPLILQRLEGFL